MTEIPTEALEQLQAVEAAMSGDEPHLAYTGGDGDDDVPPEAPVPLDNLVELPGGLVDRVEGTVEKSAEVRELDGEDEEAILRTSGNFAKMLDMILQRGVVSIGDKAASRDLLDRLLAGDRDALLVAIRRVTFGNEWEITGPCPECGTEQVLTIDLTNDIPYQTLDDAYADSRFEFECSTGKKVTVILPTGSTHRAMAAVKEPNEAVLTSMLLSRCVEEINGKPVLSPQAVKKALTMRDRREIIKEINQRTPGPRLAEVKRPCSSCEAEIALPLSLASLFLL